MSAQLKSHSEAMRERWSSRQLASAFAKDLRSAASRSEWATAVETLAAHRPGPRYTVNRHIAHSEAGKAGTSV